MIKKKDKPVIIKSEIIYYDAFNKDRGSFEYLCDDKHVFTSTLTLFERKYEFPRILFHIERSKLEETLIFISFHYKASDKKFVKRCIDVMNEIKGFTMNKRFYPGDPNGYSITLKLSDAKKIVTKKKDFEDDYTFHSFIVYLDKEKGLNDFLSNHNDIELCKSYDMMEISIYVEYEKQ